MNNNLNTISEIVKFYINSKNAFVSFASGGWLFTKSFDNHFIWRQPQISFKYLNEKHSNFFLNDSIHNISVINDSTKTIDYLNAEKSVKEKFDKLKKLIEEKNLNLIHDSFKSLPNNDVQRAQNLTFKDGKLNIMIIGGGVTGLFFASSIKNILGDKVCILILDNRSKLPNTREIFSRNWLTHIPVKTVQKNISKNISNLLGDFGKNGLIGIPLNLLESILMLSCKDQGIKFYFSPKIDYLKLNSKLISFFVDSTGGRFNEIDYSDLITQEVDVKVPHSFMNFKKIGLNQLECLPQKVKSHLDIKLKIINFIHFPYIENTKIHTQMFKIIGIHSSLLKPLIDFIKPINGLNLFYVWEGDLQDEINEGLVLVNLTIKDYKIFSNCSFYSKNLNQFINNNMEVLKSLDENINSVLNKIKELDKNNLIEIEEPFSYLPYVNLNAENGYLNNKRIFPIGDSLFCGHPKVGNGLGNHFKFINHLTEKITTINN
jgi:hypothetical protein